ncbi:MAG TPA: MFS transporter [Holophaga sp.]|nr:MFS transporter [Holophaga sp.]
MVLKHRLQHTFRAMRHGEFVVYWAGQAISVIGTWMQSTALSWLVYRITSSPVALGVMALARFGPSLLGAPFAGLLVDRFPRRKVVILTQATSLTLAIPLAYLTLTNQVQLWQLLVLAVAQGCVDTLDMTARQTFQMDIVGPEDVQSAVALNSAAFNSARMVGPVLAGVIVHFWSEGICFVLNAVSYLTVLISLFTIRGKPHVASTALGPVLREIRTGFSFVWRTPPIRVRMLAMGVTSALGLSIQTLLPVFVVSQLHGDAQSFGMLGAWASAPSSAPWPPRLPPCGCSSAPTPRAWWRSDSGWPPWASRTPCIWP